MPDAPAAVMPNGNVLIATSWGKFHTPTNFFEYSPSSNGFTAAPAMANAANVTSFQINFVVLPTGQILGVQTDNSTVQIYTPSGSFATQWQPTVTSVPTTLVAGGTYIVSGTQFAGLSEGAYYGDDVMASTNFPLMRIVNNSSQHVFYARTFNHSTRSVAANAAGSTSFKVPANIEPGASTLYVVANGIPSIGTAVCIPRVNSHDFNDDCESDVLWYNTTSGQAVVWLVSGTSVIGGGSPGSAASPWTVAGTGDFNGDGMRDILWYNTGSGQQVVWLINSATVIGGGSPGSAASPWQIQGMNAD